MQDRKLNPSCLGKKSFASAQLAHKVAQRMRQADRNATAYHCGECHSWHLGTQLTRAPLIKAAKVAKIKRREQ